MVLLPLLPLLLCWCEGWLFSARVFFFARARGRRVGIEITFGIYEGRERVSLAGSDFRDESVADMCMWVCVWV